jgi:hypothetical protein
MSREENKESKLEIVSRDFLIMPKLVRGILELPKKHKDDEPGIIRLLNENMIYLKNDPKVRIYCIGKTLLPNYMDSIKRKNGQPELIGGRINFGNYNPENPEEFYGRKEGEINNHQYGLYEQFFENYIILMEHLTDNFYINNSDTGKSPQDLEKQKIILALKYHTSFKIPRYSEEKHHSYPLGPFN